MQRIFRQFESVSARSLACQLAHRPLGPSNLVRHFSRAGRHRYRRFPDRSASASERIFIAACQHRRTFSGRRWLVSLIPLGLSPMLQLEAMDEKDIRSRSEDLEKTHHNGTDLDLDEEAGLLRRIWATLNRYIFEPLGTTRRFLYLAFIFLPVIFTAPILALEWMDSTGNAPINRQQRRKHERATTRWWYRFLVKQMERAGPTFIKVTCSSFTTILRNSFLRLLQRPSLHNGLAREETCSQTCFAICLEGCTQMESLTA